MAPRGCSDTSLSNHSTGSAGSRGSSQLTFCSVTVRSEPGTIPRAGLPPRGAVPAALPEFPRDPQPYLLLGSRAEALGSRVHGSAARCVPAGPARTRPARRGGGAGSGGRGARRAALGRARTCSAEIRTASPSHRASEPPSGTRGRYTAPKNIPPSLRAAHPPDTQGRCLYIYIYSYSCPAAVNCCNYIGATDSSSCVEPSLKRAKRWMGWCWCNGGKKKKKNRTQKV